MKITMETKKREETLNQRVNAMEEKNKELTKEIERLAISKEKTEREIELYQDTNNELLYKHNEMVSTINTIITELNYVITSLNNKHQEN